MASLSSLSRVPIFFLLAVVTISSIMPLSSASGVSSPYWNGENAQPLTMQPGETREFVLNLQNMMGDEDVTFRGQIIDGKEFVAFADDGVLYAVPHGTKKEVHVRATAPSNALIGDRHNLKFEFTTVTESGSGEFRLGSAMELSFDMVIGDKPPAPTSPSLLGNSGISFGMLVGVLIAIAVLVAGLVYFVKRRNTR